MKELLNLLKVKTIVTIALTAIFIVGVCYGIITGEQLIKIYTMVIAFYFCTQANKGG